MKKGLIKINLLYNIYFFRIEIEMFKILIKSFIYNK